MKICGVYKIENRVTGKIYIGRSIDIQKRWSWHLSRLRHGKHNIDELQKDYNMLGTDCFSFVILEECEFYELRQREQWWLDNKESIYNHRKTAESTWQHTEEQRKESYIRRSQAQAGENNPRARLTLEQVFEIRKLLENGNLKQYEIARMYMVSPMQISRIANGSRW